MIKSVKIGNVPFLRYYQDFMILQDIEFHKRDALRRVTNFRHRTIHFAASQSSVLKMHKASKHYGVRFPCNECDYSATLLSSLRRHKESKHEGIRYPCDFCDFTSVRASYLKKHIELKHSSDV